MKQTVNPKEINEVSVEIEVDDNITDDEIQYAAEMAIQDGNGIYGNTEYNDGIFVDACTFYQLRAAVQLLLYRVSIPTVVAYIYNLYEEYLISDVQERILYELADPEEEFNTPSEYWNNLDVGSDENPLYLIAKGKKDVKILDKEVAA